MRIDPVPALTAAARFLCSHRKVQTRRSYARGLGLSYAAWRYGYCDLVEQVTARYRTRLRCAEPYVSAVHPELSWLPWCFERGIDPLGEGTCDDPLPLFAEDLARHAHGPAGRRLGLEARRARINAVRAFYRWAARMDVTGRWCNPTSGLRATALGLSTPRSTGLLLSSQQLAALVTGATRYGKSPWYRARGEALVRLLRDTGLRLHEVQALDVHDLDWPAQPGLMGVLRLRDEKGAPRESTTLVSPATVAAIERMLRTRPECWLPHDPDRLVPELEGQRLPMFASRPTERTALYPGSGRIGRDSVEATLKGAARMSGDPSLAAIAHRVSVHDVRKAQATALLDAGVPIEAVAEWGRWASIDTVRNHYDLGRPRRKVAGAWRAMELNARADQAIADRNAS